MTKKETAKDSTKTEAPAGSKDEQIGFHKGSLTTLAKERQEFMRILGIVEQLMQVHIGALKELGIDLAAEAAKMQQTAAKNQPKTSKPLESTL